MSYKLHSENNENVNVLWKQNKYFLILHIVELRELFLMFCFHLNAFKWKTAKFHFAKRLQVMQLLFCFLEKVHKGVCTVKANKFQQLVAFNCLKIAFIHLTGKRLIRNDKANIWNETR